MRRFKDLLKTKFVWGPRDVDHSKPKKETPEERTEKYIWQHGDVEHHDLKETLEEKFHLAPDAKGNFDNPHQVNHSPYHPSHPHIKAHEPEEGDEAHDAFLAHHENL